MRSAVAAKEFELDEWVFFLERVFHRAHDLIDDQRGIPRDFAFFFRALEQDLLPIRAIHQGDVFDARRAQRRDKPAPSAEQEKNDAHSNTSAVRICHAEFSLEYPYLLLTDAILRSLGLSSKRLGKQITIRSSTQEIIFEVLDPRVTLI